MPSAVSLPSTSQRSLRSWFGASFPPPRPKLSSSGRAFLDPRPRLGLSLCANARSGAAGLVWGNTRWLGLGPHALQFHPRRVRH